MTAATGPLRTQDEHTAAIQARPDLSGVQEVPRSNRSAPTAHLSTKRPSLPGAVVIPRSAISTHAPEEARPVA
jgi:hypothetical protein